MGWRWRRRLTEGRWSRRHAGAAGDLAMEGAYNRQWDSDGIRDEYVIVPSEGTKPQRARAIGEALDPNADKHPLA